MAIQARRWLLLVLGVLFVAPAPALAQDCDERAAVRSRLRAEATEIDERIVVLRAIQSGMNRLDDEWIERHIAALKESIAANLRAMDALVPGSSDPRAWTLYEQIVRDQRALELYREIQLERSLEVIGSPSPTPFGRQLAAMEARRTEIARQISLISDALASLGCGSAGGSCALPATWNHNTPELGSSTWTVAADGTARESGLGNATGSATLIGRVLTIRWSTPAGYAGNVEVRFDESCNRGTGSGAWTTTPPGVAPRPFTSTWSRTAHAAGCRLESRWRADIEGLNSASWQIGADGRAQESGLGNAAGTARLDGRSLRIDWTTANGYAGEYVIALNDDCSAGDGRLTQTTTPPGVRPLVGNSVHFTRLD